MPTVGTALWAAAAGALIPVMAVLNARLGRALGEPLHAAFVLFVVGAAMTAVVSLLITGRLPAPGALLHAAPVDSAGGLIVGFYVISVTMLAPRLGVANTIVFVMTAQIVCSSVVDHFGLLGAPVRPLDATRLAGLGLVLVGLVVSQMAPGRSPDGRADVARHASRSR